MRFSCVFRLLAVNAVQLGIAALCEFAGKKLYLPHLITNNIPISPKPVFLVKSSVELLAITVFAESGNLLIYMICVYSENFHLFGP